MDPIVIVAAKRSPLGMFQGCLSDLSAPDIASQVIQQTCQQINLEQIQSCIMGCVLPAGLGQAPARQAALNAGLAQSTLCTTINKVCGSGMQSVMMSADALTLGCIDIAIAGGMESMSNAPYLLAKARQGYRLGHQQLIDHMFIDGLEDAYEKKAMGVYAEQTAEHYGFTRDDQDGFAIQSLEKAQKAQQQGGFDEEIAAITYHTRKGNVTVSEDEGPRKASSDKIKKLKPAFKKDGTVTPANASSISDGAAVLLMMRQSTAEQQQLQPLAKIVGYHAHAQAPEWFTTAPVGAIQGLLAQIQWNKDDVDLFEINEAFAVVTMAAMQELALDPNKVNVHGGACALGHPLGASGARIIVSLIHAMKKQQKQHGVAALCIGGGEATAMALELL